MKSIDDIKHRDGLPWNEAPIPPRLHRCTPWTTAWMDFFTLIERCACGAIRMRKSQYDSKHWMDKNARKKCPWTT